MKPVVAWMTAAAVLAGPMLGCKSEKKEKAEVTEPAAVDSDEPFVLELVEVTVRKAELDRPGQQAGQQTGQPGQQTGQPETTAAAARGQGTTGARDQGDKGAERAGTAAKQQASTEKGTAATTSATGPYDDEMKPLSHAQKELRELEKTVDTLAPYPKRACP